MKPRTRASSVARFILVGTAMLLPSASLIPFGGLYLWEKGWLLWWAGSALVTVWMITLLQHWMFGDQQVALSDPVSTPAEGNPSWNPLEQRAWSDVQGLAAQVQPDRALALDSLVALGRSTLSAVAGRLHPEKSNAELQFTVPELMAISERVSRRLGQFVTTNIPFGDRMTVAQFWRLYRMRPVIDLAEKAYDVWRLMRLANPATAAAHETRDRLSRAMLNWGRDQITVRLTRAYVEEVGRAAIDLYGGRLRTMADDSAVALEPVAEAAATGSADKPVSVLIAGGSPTGREKLAAALKETGGLTEARVESRDHEALTSTDSVRMAISSPITVHVEARARGPRDTVRQVVAQARAADLIVWLFDDASAPWAHDRAKVAAVRRYFEVRSWLYEPQIIAVVTSGHRYHPASAGHHDPVDSMLDDVADLFAVTPAKVDEPPVDVFDLRDHEPARVNDLMSKIERAMPRARRVHATREIELSKAKPRGPGPARQLLSGLGSIVRSALRRGGSDPAGR